MRPLEILESVLADDLADLKQSYLASLDAPFDGMWEAFANLGRHREIGVAGERAGFFCVNDDGRLLQFYVAPSCEPLAPEIFAAIVARDEVSGAIVSTADRLFLGLCLDSMKRIEVHTYLYRDHGPGEPAYARAAETTLAVVEAGELETIAELQRGSLEEDPGDWLVGHLENLIARCELYALRRGGEVLATGEARSATASRRSPISA